VRPVGGLGCTGGLRGVGKKGRRGGKIRAGPCACEPVGCACVGFRPKGCLTI
jgi:hypothetical protein